MQTHSAAHLPLKVTHAYPIARIGSGIVMDHRGSSPDRTPRRGDETCIASTRSAAERRRAGARLGGMCRNIRTLHNFEPAATDEEVRSAALQYVRKISGMNKPSRANEAAFQRAIEEVAEASTRLLDSLVTQAPPKDRQAEAAKARARSAGRYAA